MCYQKYNHLEVVRRSELGFLQLEGSTACRNRLSHFAHCRWRLGLPLYDGVYTPAIDAKH